MKEQTHKATVISEMGFIYHLETDSFYSAAANCSELAESIVNQHMEQTDIVMTPYEIELLVCQVAAEFNVDENLLCARVQEEFLDCDCDDSAFEQPWDEEDDWYED